MTSVIIIILLVVVIIAIIFLATTALKKNNGNDNLLFTQMSELRTLMEKQTSTIDAKMLDSAKHVNETMKDQFGESQKLVNTFLKEITNITEKVTRVEETGKQMSSFTEQLKQLGDILKNPKQRGVLGEYYLETLLKNVLPPGGYEMQYHLGKDEEGNELIPDAVVKVKGKLIPVDSKFSLENYNRFAEEKNQTEKDRLEKLFREDLKRRIIETSKYIQPRKGTMDFAFMFIPHEAIYYDLLVNKIGLLDEENFIQRAASKYKVIIVSPTSFLAYLQTVLQALNAMHIEEQAKDIIKRVGDLAGHLQVFAEKHQKLGRSIGTVVNQYSDSSKEFNKINKDITRISDGKNTLEFEPLEIAKPEVEE